MATKIEEHYGSDDLESKIFQGLERAGKDMENLSLKDLSVIDQLHTGGHLATLSLVKTAGLTEAMTVLDAGCGIGGTTRLLAETVGCSVTGLDLVDSFIRISQRLTTSTGLDAKTAFRQGDVCSMPFKNNEFDCVWSQHTLMNIQDKEAVFAEFLRVLKPGGLLVLHEVFSGGNADLQLPVPWAAAPEISFLEPWSRTRERLSKAGMACRLENDLSVQAKTWWQKVKEALEKAGQTPRPLGPHIIFGENGRHFGKTMSANLDNQSIQVIEAIFKKPG